MLYVPIVLIFRKRTRRPFHTVRRTTRIDKAGNREREREKVTEAKRLFCSAAAAPTNISPCPNRI
jgi:hypothetical protein